MAWGDLPLLADTSAWARVRHDPEGWQQAVSDERLVTCSVIELELLYSARSRAAVTALLDELSVLRHLAITQTIMDAAVASIADLARRGADGSHRVAPADAMIAACAAEHGCAVLHYDRHYDRLAEVLGFTSIWLAPAGSV